MNHGGLLSAAPSLGLTKPSHLPLSSLVPSGTGSNVNSGGVTGYVPVSQQTVVPQTQTQQQVQPQPSSSASRLGEKSPEMTIEERMDNGAVRRYKRGKLLGKGGFARCYEVVDTTNGKLYACKAIAKSSLAKPRAKAKLDTEIEIQASLHHQNIVSFYKSFEDKDWVYIILEICPNQTLMELVKRRRRLTEPEAQYFLLQLVSACKEMQRNKVIHRDLKLGNLFLGPDMDIKVGDFGLATRLAYDGEKKRTICGTPNYIAPEILEGRKGHSYEVDAWSIGVILYTLLIGKPPFETSDVKSTYKKIKANSYSFPENIKISEEARSLIRRLLNGNPEARPTFNDILAHPFMARAHRLPKFLPKIALTSVPHDFVEESIRNGAIARQPLGEIQHSSSTGSSSGVPAEKLAPKDPYMKLTSERENNNNNNNNNNVGSTGAGSLFTSSSAQQLQPMQPMQPHQPGQLHGSSGSSSAQQHRPVTAYATIGRNANGPTVTAVQPTTSSGSLASVASRLTDGAEEVRRALERPTLGSAGLGSSVGSGSSSSLNSARARPATTGGSSNVSPTLTTGGTTVPTSTAASRHASSSGAGKPSAAVADDDMDADDRGALEKLRNHLEISLERAGLEKMHQNLEASLAGSKPGFGFGNDDDAHGDYPGGSSSSGRNSAGSNNLLAAASALSGSSGALTNLPAPIWVTKWVDYSNKYGLGYQLSDNTTGVYFNDSTKIILASNNENIDYYDRKRTPSGSYDEKTSFTLSEYPAALQKKVTLLKHFKNYLVEHTAGPSTDENNPGNVAGAGHGLGGAAAVGSVGSTDANGQMVYVKKWMMTNHAIIFRLSNKTVQVNFFDHTKVILSSESRVVTYVNKQRKLTTYPLHSVMTESKPELARRLKYAKDILYQLISKQGTGSTGTNPPAMVGNPTADV